MGTYDHYPILVSGPFASDVREARQILISVIVHEAPTKHHIAMDIAQVPQVVEVANAGAWLFIPPSGGKQGGNQEARWKRYREEWKREIEEHRVTVDWVEIKVGEGEPEEISDSWSRHRERYRESIDPH